MITKLSGKSGLGPLPDKYKQVFVDVLGDGIKTFGVATQGIRQAEDGYDGYMSSRTKSGSALAGKPTDRVLFFKTGFLGRH